MKLCTVDPPAAAPHRDRPIPIPISRFDWDGHGRETRPRRALVGLSRFLGYGLNLSLIHSQSPTSRLYADSIMPRSRSRESFTALRASSPGLSQPTPAPEVPRTLDACATHTQQPRLYLAGAEDEATATKGSSIIIMVKEVDGWRSDLAVPASCFRMLKKWRPCSASG